jgi:hypothetical protein
MYDEAMLNIGKGLIDLDTNTFKAALSNTAPTQDTHDELADATEIAAGNGYTVGGFTLTATWAETGAGTGVWRFDTDNPSWTAAGGDIATHRYLIVYDDTSVGDKLLGYVDQGASSVISNGNTRTWTVGAGLFDITVP